MDTWLARTKRARALQAQTWATMEGWQAGQDTAFDAFVADKRRERDFERFDQRVEHAYRAAVRAHTREIWNGAKRELKKDNKKYSHDVLVATNRRVEERSEWLRDVFAQIDVDYRSPDADRRDAAADEIGKALRGEASDFVTWAYDRKGAARGMGPKMRMQAAAESNDDADMPEISEHEANRYLNLKPKMADVERLVKDRFGRAGEEHWELLQKIKDDEYVEKLERAAVKYNELREQHQAYEDAYDALGSNMVINRQQTAAIRFKAAMEIEDQRLKLVEAHAQLRKERFEAARREQREKLQRAAELRAEGKSSDDVAAIMREQTMAKLTRENDEAQASEWQELQRKKKTFLALIDRLEEEAEHRDGMAMMSSDDTVAPAGSAGTDRSAAVATAPGAAMGSPSSSVAKPPAPAGSPTDRLAGLLDEARALAKERTDSGPAALKRALWDVVNGDAYGDPYLTVHQARLDARAHFSDVGRWDKVHKKRLGHWGDIQATTDAGTISGWRAPRYIFKNPELESSAYDWGMTAEDIANLEQDTTAVFSEGMGGATIRRVDMKTHDVDYTEERRLGLGPIWRGKRLYKLGYDEAHKDAPHMRPMKEKDPAARPPP